MRILHLAHSRHFAGSEQSVLTLCQILKAQGHEVLVGVKSGGILRDRYRREGLEVIDLPLNSWFVARRLAKFASNAKIDLIHAHLTQAARIGCRVHRLTGIPLVTHLRILRDAPVYHEAARLGLLVANSRYTAQFYRETAGIAEDRIRVVPNATPAMDDPLAELSKQELAGEVKRELSLPADARLIAFSGRVSPEKGHALMLQAMPAVLKQHPNTHVLVVGDLEQKNSYGRKLQRLQAQLGLRANVHFLGFRREVLRFTRAAEAQLVLSKREPFGLVIIEAMAMGTPIIGTDAGAIRQVLEHGTLGTLIPPDNPKAVAETLISLLDRSAPFLAKAEAAVHRVRELYSPAVLATGIARVYAETLRKSPAGSNEANSPSVFEPLSAPDSPLVPSADTR